MHHDREHMRGTADQIGRGRIRLAQALVDAGAVTGMELDIHTGLTEFNSWTVDHTGTLTPTTILPGVQNRPDRYLAPDQRDFFYLTLTTPTPNRSASA